MLQLVLRLVVVLLGLRLPLGLVLWGGQGVGCGVCSGRLVVVLLLLLAGLPLCARPWVAHGVA